MSLFNETWARADRAERALELAQRRVAELELAIKNVRKDKTSDYWWRGRDAERPGRRRSSQHNELNTLSKDDVELMFAHHRSTDSPRQRHRHSLLEAALGTAIGYVVAFALNLAVLPALGLEMTLAQNFWYVNIFTVASVLRVYAVRRLFERLHSRGLL